MATSKGNRSAWLGDVGSGLPSLHVSFLFFLQQLAAVVLGMDGIDGVDLELERAVAVLIEKDTSLLVVVEEWVSEIGCLVDGRGSMN
ncbi:hypothetical protein M0R45_026048 [Rubus argutus]|uniref:Uncharacterized protein n=1 Tax=Rubus argutus TaxID=59490 RepID=A0AAW1WYX6_RUBAR